MNTNDTNRIYDKIEDLKDDFNKAHRVLIDATARIEERFQHVYTKEEVQLEIQKAIPKKKTSLPWARTPQGKKVIGLIVIIVSAVLTALGIVACL